MNCMNDKCLVDTNILIYAHDRSAGQCYRAIQVVNPLVDTVAP
jgi:predicted nucleic acid-binding protein